MAMYANPTHMVLIQLATPNILNRGLEKYTEALCPLVIL